MFSYKAPNPYPSKSHVFFTSSGIGKLVVYAQKREPEEIADSIGSLEEQYDVAMLRGWVMTHDKAVLDTIEVQPTSKRVVPIEERRFIVKFNGNDVLYESLLIDYVADATILDATVVGFNYRGVARIFHQ